jgi:hypothetical protein
LRCAERVALPAVTSISPTRLIDDSNMVQSRGDFKTALLPQNVRHLFMMPSLHDRA